MIFMKDTFFVYHVIFVSPFSINVPEISCQVPAIGGEFLLTLTLFVQEIIDIMTINEVTMAFIRFSLASRNIGTPDFR